MRHMRESHKISTEPFKVEGRDLTPEEEPAGGIGAESDIPDIEPTEHVPLMRGNPREETDIMSSPEE